MRNTFLLIIAAAAVAVLQAGFVRALPAPVRDVDLTLIMVVMLITAFRFSGAFAAAATAGLVGDALSSFPFGTRTLVLLAVTAVTVVLFNRVFTHHSWQGSLALHVTAFALSGGTYALIRLARATLEGSAAAATVVPWWQAALGATACQLVAAILVMALVAAGRRSFSRFLYIRSHA